MADENTVLGDRTVLVLALDTVGIDESAHGIQGNTGAAPCSEVSSIDRTQHRRLVQHTMPHNYSFKTITHLFSGRVEALSWFSSPQWVKNKD